MNLKKETVERLENIEKISSDIDETLELMSPLIESLMPVRKEFLVNNIPEKKQVVQLEKKDWKKQYEAGVNRCVGIEIEWR